MNQLELIAVLAERESLRYTPAGIPIVVLRLSHSSTQTEAGIARSVEFEILAVAAGEMAGGMAQAELGGTYQFKGFLARRSRNSKALVFHITGFE